MWVMAMVVWLFLIFISIVAFQGWFFVMAACHSHAVIVKINSSMQASLRN